MVEHKDFRLGLRFKTLGGRWQVTDLGQRTVVAVPLESEITEFDLERSAVVHRNITIESDPSWWKGPPYSVAECVFTESDFPACQPL